MMKLLSPQRLAATIGIATTLSMIGAQAGHAALFNFANFNLSAFSSLTATQNTNATNNTNITKFGGPFANQSTTVSTTATAIGFQNVSSNVGNSVNSNQF